MATALLRNPHLLVLVIVILFVGGANALRSLPRLEDPRLTNRNPLVLTFLPGASAEQVEAQVTEPLERELREIAEVKKIESTSSLGVSSIAIELADDIVDPTPALADLRSALDRGERKLPTAATRPWLDDQRGAAAYGLIVAVRWRASSTPDLALLDRYAAELADRLRRIDGTEIVRVHGDVDERVLVEPEPGELSARGLGLDRLAAMLAAADTKLPAGSLRLGASDPLVAVAGEFATLDRVRSVPIATADAATTELGAIATVRRGHVTPTVALATVDGERGTLVGARMQADRLADAWSAAARREIAALAHELDGTVALDVVFDQSTYTNARLASLAWNLVLGALLIWLVVAALMGSRIGTLVAATLPLAAAAILLAMQLLSVPLHQMSLFGLLVAMGLLIDNAIVVCDTVADLRRHGHAPADAVSLASRTLAMPLFASTLTTVLSFAPILLLQGNVGEFVGTIGTTVVLSLTVSLVLSLTVVTALAGWLPLPATADAPSPTIDDANAPTRGFGRLMAHLRRPRLLLLATLLPPVLGFAVTPTLRDQFFPAADRDQFQVEIWAEGGASLQQTTALMQRADAVLRREPQVTQTFWVAGQSVPSVYYNQLLEQDDAPFYAQGVVVARDVQSAKELVRRAERELPALLPEAHVVVRPFMQGPPIAAPVVLRLVGDELARLIDGGDAVRAVMAATPGVLHTRASIPAALPAAELRFDEPALRQLGLSTEQAAQQLRAQLGGMPAGEVLEGTERIPVLVQGPLAERTDPARLLSATLVAAGPPATTATAAVNGPKALEMPVAAVADLAVAPRIPAITRRNGERCNELLGFVGADTLPIEVLALVQANLRASGFTPPPGTRLELGGDAEESAAAAEQLVRYVPLLATVTMATLILAFRSLAIALLLGVVGVLSAGYGLLSLWLGGYPLGFNPLIGLAGLVGVTFNDSIVVLAAIRADAVARTGDAAAMARVIRGCMRHVWATTLTTAVGFVPFVVFSGGDFWPPLAVVIAGGVLGATPLALVFVPQAYAWLVRRLPSLVREVEVQS